MVEAEEKYWEQEWRKDPELMELVRKCGEYADWWEQRFHEFDAIVAWAQQIAEESGGEIVEKHFDCIRIEFEKYPERLNQLQRKHPGVVILRDRMGDQRPEMEIELGWGVESPRSSGI